MKDKPSDWTYQTTVMDVTVSKYTITVELDGVLRGEELDDLLNAEFVTIRYPESNNE